MDSYRDYLGGHQTASSTWRMFGGTSGTAGTAMPVVTGELQPQPNYHTLHPHDVPGHVGVPDLMNGGAAVVTFAGAAGYNKVRSTFRRWRSLDPDDAGYFGRP